jgi:hypothetical protein
MKRRHLLRESDKATDRVSDRAKLRRQADRQSKRKVASFAREGDEVTAIRAERATSKGGEATDKATNRERSFLKRKRQSNRQSGFCSPVKATMQPTKPL